MVFENVDLMNIIMQHFTYPELSVVREVNKDFERVGKQLYTKKYREASSESQRVYFAYLNRNRGLDMYQRAVNFASFVDEFVEKRLWPFLVHNEAFSRNIFFRAAEFHPYRKVIHRYDVIHDKIRPYLYIADAASLTVASMKQLLSYKGVKGTYRMNKSQLKRVFNSDNKKSFVWRS
tara:strand:+ start:4067 stop:4597 length:531 start_codon:yes stop_codon:yes gene_type:complete